MVDRHAVVAAVAVAIVAGALACRHIQYPYHSYNVRDDAAVGVNAWAVAVAVFGVGIGVVQRSLNVHWQFQEVRRSSVKARCSGKQVFADDGDGAQRHRSGPGVYFGRLLNSALMQLYDVCVQYINKKKKFIKIRIE